MPASAIVRKVYAEHLSRFGEPDRSVVFDASNAALAGPLERVDIFIWRPTKPSGVTIFSTIGMAALPMPKTGKLAELHLAIRGTLLETDESAIALQIANLAAYPWDTNNPLDYWHALFVSMLGFPSCTCLLIHPEFVDGGWGSIDYEETKILIFNLVPITGEERAIARQSPSALWKHWERQDLDIFERR